jgi:hypothetical protein
MKLIFVNVGKILVIIGAFFFVCAVIFGLVGGDRPPKTVQFLNQTDRRVLISYSGKNGENYVLIEEIALPFKTLRLSRLLTGESNGRYSITVSPTESKTKAKSAHLEWNGVPKSNALAYKPSDEIVWLKDD